MATPTALPASFTSGQVLTASDTNLLRGAFRTLQVKQTVQNSAVTMTSTSQADVSGMSVSITPYYTTSKVLVTVNFNVGYDGTADDTGWWLVRNSTNISIGDFGTGYSLYLRGNSSTNQNLAMIPCSITFLDSPATTSATTYKLAYYTRTGTIYLNKRGADNNFITASSITVQEISA
jgi:hypothetical protein